MTYKTKKHYESNREVYAERQRRKREEIRAYVAKVKVERGGCQECGEMHIGALDFHHRNSNEKEIGPTDFSRDKWSYKRIDQEIAKCDVLCATCHRKLHWKLEHPENPDGLLE